MKRTSLHLESTRGFTAVELILTVAILSILLAVASASYETIKAKVRYAQIKADMDAIAQAAYVDFSNNNANEWAPMSINAGMPTGPGCTMPTLLRKWPQPPCPGWFYSWEDWSTFDIGSNSVAVTLRRANNTVFLNYCVNTFGGTNCYPNPAPFGGSPVDISVWPSNHIYCNE